MRTTVAIACGALALTLTAITGPAIAGGMEGRGAAVPVPAPAPIPDYYGNYYLRVDIAYDWANSDRFDTGNDLYNQSRRRDSGLSESGRFGFGVGMYISRWLRTDFTLDTREEASAYANDQLVRSDGTSATLPNTNVTDTLRDRILYRNGVGLANLYVDLPVTTAFTPYIGAGVGVVLHSYSRNLDQSVRCTPTAPANDAAACSGIVAGYNIENTLVEKSYQYALATAAMAGFSYQVSNSLKTDVGYRWLHLDGASFSHWVGTQTAFQTVKIPDQNIHEMRVGLRWDIN